MTNTIASILAGAGLFMATNGDVPTASLRSSFTVPTEDWNATNRPRGASPSPTSQGGGDIQIENSYGGAQQQITSRAIVAGKLVLTFQSHSPCFAAVYPSCQGHDRAWKEVYTVGTNGNVVLEKVIEGQVSPARTIPQSVEWPNP